jgi:hypothetical protein
VALGKVDLMGSERRHRHEEIPQALEGDLGIEVTSDEPHVPLKSGMAGEAGDGEAELEWSAKA